LALLPWTLLLLRLRQALLPLPLLLLPLPCLSLSYLLQSNPYRSRLPRLLRHVALFFVNAKTSVIPILNPAV
jgi:hypothetical protein